LRLDGLGGVLLRPLTTVNVKACDATANHNQQDRGGGKRFPVGANRMC